MDKKNSYETLFIIDASLAEDAIKALVEKFSALIAENGTVSEVNEWGLRKLAYPIQKKSEGYYVVMQFTAAPELPKELDRRLRISDSCMRHIIVTKDA